ncbi:Subtilisin-like protease 1 [Castilleja foliolosa]|uniref:RING-type E3 ubiquitin transferase n=1 Tax=Castilleja foliolosa TaxID=1961234 RepID=A0ABD3E1P5_9LAMI
MNLDCTFAFGAYGSLNGGSTDPVDEKRCIGSFSAKGSTIIGYDYSVIVYNKISVSALSSVVELIEDDPSWWNHMLPERSSTLSSRQEQRKDVDVLKSVTRVNQLKDLAQLLNAASNVLPLVVTVSGRVGSDTPISCEYSGIRGVIVEQTAEQHFLKHNDAGSWIQDSALMLSMCKEVPWYLDDGTGRVNVVGARGATGLILTVGSEVFEESGRSLVRGTLDYLQGLKMLGVKRIERVLPTGSPLTVVGECFHLFRSQAVKDDVGSVWIQKPHKGPFYVTNKTIDQLIANLGKWSRLYKYASTGFTVFGVYLLAKHAVQFFMERRRHWEMRKRVFDAVAAKKAEQDGGSNGQAENGPDTTNKDKMMPNLCVICLEQDYNSVFVPVRSYVLLYGVLFTVDELSTVSKTV